MLETHRRAFASLLRSAGVSPGHLCIVGGALFPRSVIVLRELLPSARITVIDVSPENLRKARDYIGELDDRIHLQHGTFDPTTGADFDAVVIPTAYVGDRRALYESAQSLTFFHEWVWRVRGDGGIVVSWLLLKRVNFVRGRGDGVAARPSSASTRGFPTA